MEEDLLTAMVPFDVSLELLELPVSLDNSLSALEPVFRRRNSLKKGILRGL